MAGFKWPNKAGPGLLNNPLIKEEIEKVLVENKVKASVVIQRLTQMAETNAAEFMLFKSGIDAAGNKTVEFDGINWEAVQKKGFLVKKVSYSRTGVPVIEFHDPQLALDRLGRHLGLFTEKISDAPGGGKEGSGLTSLPADLVAPNFLSAFRDIKDHRHTEYLFYGGRGSTKSSFISLVTIYLLLNNPQTHALATRQVANTLRDSVYSQLVWAINELGLSDSFTCTTSPLEITYKPTKQKIYFRGADDPGKMKSIKPAFGYIGILWFEELDQYHGEEAIRKIEQSVIRGGETAYIFKSFNPPRTAANWANKYCKIPKATQYQHQSNYLSVPTEWLGKTFIEEAEHLKSVNPGAYEHEYMGAANGTGGLVFENVKLREITDEEISQFDHITYGGDWGYYPDPADFGPVHFDAARRILYLFGEYRAWKLGNPKLYEGMMNALHPGPDDLLILDSAEPKSVADFRQYASDGIPLLDSEGNPTLDPKGNPIMLFGPTCRGAEKGADSVKYSIKWMQGLTEIVIDPKRCPYAAQEFLDYEYEQDPDGNFISEYPDKDNHSIDRTRYATNLIWRKRGQ